jgi:hypothetical protein
VGPLLCESVRVPIGGGIFLLLEEEAAPELACLGELAAIPGLPDGWHAKASNRRLDAPAPAHRPPILFDPVATERGLHNLRIFELRDHAWEISGDANLTQRAVTVTSSLKRQSIGTFGGRVGTMVDLGLSTILVLLGSKRLSRADRPCEFHSK